jgi:hypothetical protein
LGAFSGAFSTEIASHGAGIYLVVPVPEPKSGTDSIIGTGILFGVLRRPARRKHCFGTY